MSKGVDLSSLQLNLGQYNTPVEGELKGPDLELPLQVSQVSHPVIQNSSIGTYQSACTIAEEFHLVTSTAISAGEVSLPVPKRW